MSLYYDWISDVDPYQFDADPDPGSNDWIPDSNDADPGSARPLMWIRPRMWPKNRENTKRKRKILQIYMIKKKYLCCVWSYDLCALNKVKFLFSKIWYSGYFFHHFVWKFPMISTDFLLLDPDPHHWYGSGRPKWSGSDRIRIHIIDTDLWGLNDANPTGSGSTSRSNIESNTLDIRRRKAVNRHQSKNLKVNQALLHNKSTLFISLSLSLFSSFCPFEMNALWS